MGPSEDAGHLPVMPQETLRFLAIQPGDTAVDLTAGRGGHAALMAAAVRSGRLILMDVDAGNLHFAQARARAAAPPGSSIAIDAVHGSFDGVERAVNARGVRASAVLADLGFSSTQMEDAARGFSFLRDGPLDMRLDPSSGQTAAELLAHMSQPELADAIYQLGEDPFARAIARTIVQRRQHAPIATTTQLADAVRAAYGAKARQSRMHPATRTFMALRILVNDELGALDRLLAAVERGARAAAKGAPTWLEPGARVGIISFHSLEDRAVKQAFSGLERDGFARRLTRKPTTPTAQEEAANSRARSAKLRVVQVGGAEPVAVVPTG